VGSEQAQQAEITQDRRGTQKSQPGGKGHKAQEKPTLPPKKLNAALCAVNYQRGKKTPAGAKRWYSHCLQERTGRSPMRNMLKYMHKLHCDHWCWIMLAVPPAGLGSVDAENKIHMGGESTYMWGALHCPRLLIS
jgi:hypothetical protein